MPEISRFFGIVIAMFYNDHSPPHFHVRYSGQKAVMEIETLAIREGKLTPRVLGLVTEWASLHQEELREDWRRAHDLEPLERIAPLE